MLDDLAALLLEHCAALEPGRPWGWKEPRSIYLLPFFHRHLPALRFLHVVRDGRDMALSDQPEPAAKARRLPLRFPADLAGAGAVDRALELGEPGGCAVRRGAPGRPLPAHQVRGPVRATRRGRGRASSRSSSSSGIRTRAARLVGRPASSLGRWRSESAATIAALEEHGEARPRRAGVRAVGHAVAPRRTVGHRGDGRRERGVLGRLRLEPSRGGVVGGLGRLPCPVVWGDPAADRALSPGAVDARDRARPREMDDLPARALRQARDRRSRRGVHRGLQSSASRGRPHHLSRERRPVARR